MNKQIDTIRLLMAYDPDNRAEEVGNHLRNAGYAVRMTVIHSMDELNQHLNDHPWDLVIAREKMTHLGADQILKVSYQQHLNVPLIILTDDFSSLKVTQGYELGADAVVSDDDERQLIYTVTRLRNALALQRERDILENEIHES